MLGNPDSYRDPHFSYARTVTNNARKSKFSKFQFILTSL